MPEDTFFSIIILYVLLNLILFILYKITNKLRILHKIVSVIDNIIFIFIVGYGFYRVNPLLVILVPCVLLIVYPVSWELNKELSDDDVASVVILRSPFLLREESRKKLKLGFAHFGTFPFYYLLDSWKKA
jgi:hypothetical protein